MTIDITLPKVEFVPSAFYIYYNDEGNITDILNYKKKEGKYVEVSEDFINEFRSSNKDINFYTLKIDNTIKLEKKPNLIRFDSMSIVNDANSNAECLILVSKNNLNFKLLYPEVNKKINNDKQYKFYIVDSRNLNFLKDTIYLTNDQIIAGYNYAYCFDREKEIIVTKRYFDSYGIIYE